MRDVSRHPMKSPICALCGKNFGSEHFHTGKGGELVQFSDFVPLEKGAVGHPRGLLWFCAEHAAAANTFDQQTSEKALQILRERFEIVSLKSEYSPTRDPALWITGVGPNRAKVFSIVRQATGLPPATVISMLERGEFQVAEGWPKGFTAYEKALREAGASVEIRYDG